MLQPRFRTPTLVILTALVALCLGLLWGGHPDTLPGFLRDVFVNKDDAVRAEIINDIRDQFYKPVSKSRLEQASIAGIVNSLGDRFSQYFTPAETKVFNQQLNGQFEGVGMKIDDSKSGTAGLFVSDVFKGSPAAKAGIQKGDRIVAVDNRSILHEKPQVSVTRIRGPAGTTVRLTYRRGGTGPPRTVSVVRKRLNVPLVDARIITRRGMKVGYDLLAEFDKDAHVQLRNEIDSQLRQGAKGILLDLRGDPGGELDEGVDVGSIFLNKGLLVVSTRGRHQP
jgi:carboxyl-terminal processing protease